MTFSFPLFYYKCLIFFATYSGFYNKANRWSCLTKTNFPPVILIIVLKKLYELVKKNHVLVKGSWQNCICVHRHNRLNHHMNKRFKLVPSAPCICLEGHQTAEHVLQRCPRLQKVREEVWPWPECLETKLYGGKEDLESTALFIRLAKLKI